jgi:DNA-binding winged helix-turn-helix (wHTH) protein
MTTGKRTIYEFGGFTLDASGRRLLRRETGEPIALTSKVFDTLLFLVEHRGEVLDKDRLLRAIWPGMVVEENNLVQNISTLRQVLGETRAENRFIATVSRKGYQFVAAVVERDDCSATQSAVNGGLGPVAVAGKSRRRIWMAAAALVLALAAGAVVVSRLLPKSNPLSSAIGGTRDPEAYLLYSHGRLALSKSEQASLDLAVGYFTRAIARDPRFALAYERLAECYTVMGIFGMRPPPETFPKARDSVLTALRIEPRLVPALATLGQIKMQYDRDWDGAEAEFRHAIGIDPSIPEPHLYLGVLMGMRGDVDRGLEELKKSQQLEPLLTLSKTRTGSLLYLARRYREAEQEINESLALDDRPAIAHRQLGRVYMQTGRYELALAEFAKSRGLSPGSYADVPSTLAMSGHRAEALVELDRLLTLAKQRYVPPLDIAAAYACLGDSDDAMLWLNQALDQRAPTLGFLAQNPAFDSLHHDPRFVALVEQIGVFRKPLAP